jgi:DNA-binding transcriptional regulator YhcF (GntR family)
VKFEDLGMNAPKLYASNVPRSPRGGTNYKFQRMRERLRAAIASGELHGKLPGERLLARRFKVNVKTLSKSLTDLAAEGVLERVIGLGTFVRGQVKHGTRAGRWLIVNSTGDAAVDLIEAITNQNPDCEIIGEVSGVRPSYLSQFAGVIDLSPHTSDEFLRDLMVRNVPVVLVNREPGALSLHAVLVDVALGGARLAREMLLAGHRRLMTVEQRGSSVLTHAVRQVAARYATDAIVESCFPEEIRAIFGSGARGVICDSAQAGAAVRRAAAESGVQIPDQISLAAAGSCREPVPCSGYFASVTELAAAIAGILRNAQPSRPAVLWLNGEWRDVGTILSLMPIAAELDAAARHGIMI